MCSSLSMDPLPSSPRWLLFAFVVSAVLLTTTTTVQSANVLILSGSLSAGHHIWNRVIATSLVERGHNVTFLTPEQDVADLGNDRLHFIHMEGVYEKVAQKHSYARANHLQAKKPVFRRIKESYRVRNGISAEMARTKGVHRLLNYPNTFQFDIIIHDTSAAQSLLGFWLHFNQPPLIAVSPTTVPVHLFQMAAMPLFPGVMLHPYADYSAEVVLANRVYNTLYYLYDRIFRTFPFMSNENAIAKRLFGEQLMTVDLETIERNTELFLVNTNPVIDASLLLPPSVIPVGAIQMHRKGKLPKDVQMFLDASRNGVIVFSLGAGMFTPSLTRDEDEVFLEVFQHLYQYDFLWKYDKTEKLDCPRNVLMLDWLENQHLILQHPKVKLFITNGGPLSVQEAAHAGVSLLGIPLRFDQRQTLTKMQHQGVAQLLPLRRLRNDTLISAIMKGLENHSSYQGNATRLAQILHSQPNSASTSVQRAVDWIEYVVENADLRHLQSPLANVPFRVVYSLDMVLAMVVAVIGFWAIFFKHMVLDKMLTKAKEQKKSQEQQPPPQMQSLDNREQPLNSDRELLAIMEQTEEGEGEDKALGNANEDETDKKNE